MVRVEEGARGEGTEVGTESEEWVGPEEEGETLYLTAERLVSDFGQLRLELSGSISQH